jgi:hypothetical protein
MSLYSDMRRINDETIQKAKAYKKKAAYASCPKKEAKYKGFEAAYAEAYHRTKAVLRKYDSKAPKGGGGKGSHHSEAPKASPESTD